MYWHIAWLQMEELPCALSPRHVVAFFPPHCVSLWSVVSQALLLFTPPFMFPSLAWSITHWCCFYDLVLWSLSLSVFLSTNLLVCCSRERIADWLWFILTPASVLWLAESCVYPTGWYTAPQIPEPAPNILELQCCDVMWLDMEDINFAFSQISTSLSLLVCMDVRDNSGL